MQNYAHILAHYLKFCTLRGVDIFLDYLSSKSKSGGADRKLDSFVATRGGAWFTSVGTSTGATIEKMMLLVYGGSIIYHILLH